jgi:succinate---hydroxymethylglutarate CoA-transferase
MILCGTGLIFAASIVPYRSFPTSDGDILLGGGNDRLFGIISQRLGHPEWATDPKFRTNALRVENRDELERLISNVTATKTTKQWQDALEGSGLPYAAVNDIQGTLNHEHVRARNMIKTVHHPVCGEISIVDTPVKWSGAKTGLRTPPPTLGQHTDQVLNDLGYSRKDIQELKAEGVLS